MIERCPRPSPECPYYGLRPRGPLKRQQFHGCSSDTHHLMWPANRYQTRLENAFRNLPENQEQLCRWEHDERHLEEPPQKPTIQDMLRALGRLAEGETHGV